MIARVTKTDCQLIGECLQPAKSGATIIIEYNHSNHDDQMYCVNYSNAFANLSSDALLPSRGTWLRRRKIDGSVQRSPLNFYPKVHKILERSKHGIKINDMILARNPTVNEKTPEEISFALQVDITVPFTRILK